MPMPQGGTNARARHYEGARLLPVERRRAVAEAVHRGVCEATDSDGLGHCAVYAAAAVRVLGRLTGERYVLQAGSLTIRLSRAYRDGDPSGFHEFAMDATAGLGALSPLGEFHSWLGRIHPSRGTALSREEEASRHELVDLSARHFRTWVGRLDPHWPGEGDFAGDYIWTTGDQVPDGIAHIPDELTTYAVLARLESASMRRAVSRAAEVALGLLSRPAPNVGRNEPCPCGSGRKFKKCCLAMAA